MNFNRVLIIFLLFGCLVLSPLASHEKQSHRNSSQIPLVLKLTSGGSNESPELSPKMGSNQVSKQINLFQKLINQICSLKYYPNGSGSGPNPDEVISNLDFWNSYLSSEDCCPNIDIEFDNQEEWNYENEELIKIPKEIVSEQRKQRSQYKEFLRHRQPSQK